MKEAQEVGTVDPVLGEGVLGEGGAAGHAASEAELSRGDHQERKQLPARPLYKLRVAFSQPGVGQ